MKVETTNQLKKLIEAFAIKMGGMEAAAKKTVKKKGGFPGGPLRGAKGKMHEELTERLVRIAWETELQKDSARLTINKKKVPIFLKDVDEYSKTISSKKIQQFVMKGKEQFSHKLSVDKHVEVDGKLIFAIECKAYAENKMMKGALTDFYLLKTSVPNLLCYLFQLENALGGDFGGIIKNPNGSPATHALLSHFPTVELQIVTLLEGNRNAKKPIHKRANFKPLTIERLEEAVKAIVCGFKNSGAT